MATDIPTTRPMRPQADIEGVYQMLDAARFGDFPNGGDLPPFADYLVTNTAADTLAWALSLQAGLTMGIQFGSLAARADQAGGLAAAKPSGVQLIAQERRRQVEREGYAAEHDDEHHNDELSIAAACYAVAGLSDIDVLDYGGEDAWPWDAESDKRQKHLRLRRLVIAGALIAAEIDRLQRAGHRLADGVAGAG